MRSRQVSIRVIVTKKVIQQLLVPVVNVLYIDDMKINILTIGTRGDVQPYIALGLGLKAKGHDVTIATLAEFESQIVERGLKHDVLRGDYLGAAQNSEVKNPLRLIKRYAEMVRDTLADEWSSAQGADIFIYNPAAFGGYHIAEKLGVPSFAAFPTPMYSPTSEFPSPFFPFANLGPLNKVSHSWFASMSTSIYRKPISEWRRDVLKLPPVKDEKPARMLYAYSPAVVPIPSDWDESSVVTGYWFLDSPNWQPPQDLVAFLQDGPPPVYVGFGSMFMNGGKQKTEMVLEALKLTGQRGILSTGWGGLTREDVPENMFVVDSIPHDWLFLRVACVVHHGGAGTTGSGLRAGKPTVICPFVGDQPFWGRRVAALSVGPQPIPQGKLTAEKLAKAMEIAATDKEMLQRSEFLGKIICAEGGVGTAVEYLTSHL
jgi:sterol 3beta-glucosyltransferase